MDNINLFIGKLYSNLWIMEREPSMNRDKDGGQYKKVSNNYKKVLTNPSFKHKIEI